MFSDSTDTSRRGLFRDDGAVNQGQIGWYGRNGMYADGGLAYGPCHGDVDDIRFRASGEPMDEETPPTSRPRRNSHKQRHSGKKKPKEHRIQDERRYSADDDGGYERSAEVQNEAASHRGLPQEEDGALYNGYSASTHSDPWSVADTARPRAGSFGDSSDEMRPHYRGGGLLRRDETYNRIWEDIRFERSKDDALRGILSSVPRPSKRSRGSRDKHSKYPQHIDPKDLCDTNEPLPIPREY